MTPIVQLALNVAAFIFLMGVFGAVLFTFFGIIGAIMN